MKQSYYKGLLLKGNETVLLETARLFSQVEEIMRFRLQVGDAAEADLLKIGLEKNKVLRNLAGLQAEKRVEMKRLGLLLNLPEGDFDLVEDFPQVPPGLKAPDLADQALINRDDLKGQAQTIEAAQAGLAAARREGLPFLEVEAGYKRITGGIEGPVLSVSVPLPLFDRNQGGIARAQAELDQEKAAYEARKRNVVTEVAVQLEKLTALQTRVADLKQQAATARELTAIARLAYEEGEITLLELLEALRSEKDLALETHEAVYDQRIARLALERAVNLKLMPEGGGQ